MLFHRLSPFLVLLPAILFCLVPVIGYFAPRSFSVFPGVIGVLGFFQCRVYQGQFPVLSRIYIGVAAGVALLAALSSFWAIDQEFALEKAGKIALVLFPAAVLFAWGVAADEKSRNFIAAVFPLGVILGGLACAIDLYSGGGLYLLSHDNPTPHVLKFNTSLMNRGVNVFVLCALPAFYMLYKAGLDRRVVRAQFGVLACVFFAVLYGTHSQSTHVVFLLSVLIWFLFPVSKQWAWRIMQGVVVIGMISAPWVVQYLYASFAEFASGEGHWLSEAYVADRLEIWDMVARKALESPYFGLGIEATRHIEHFDTPMRYTPHDFVLHPHNFVVQLWIEFGAMGVILASGLIVYIFERMSKIVQMQERRIALIIFAGFGFMACSAYGLWQGWWLGLASYLLAWVALSSSRSHSAAAKHE